MPKIIFDTAIGSSNLGDQIIMDSVNQLVEELFKEEFLINIATHQHVHPLDLPSLRKYELAIVGGTNLLKNQNFLEAQWKIGLLDLLAFRNKAVLLGVGWWQYQSAPISAYSRFLYRNLLSSQYTHAVRDSYTKEKLATIGIHNVINTGCPTVWNLTSEHCDSIDTSKKSIVVTTITDYLRDYENDCVLLEILLREYDEVHLWLQGAKDSEYIRQLAKQGRLNEDKLFFIAPKLSAFDEFLTSRDCDYVGTRLHAGIRALQKSRRSIIIGIDNRAIEMQKDIQLKVLQREKINELTDMIHDTSPVQLTQNWENIAAWKQQFKSSK